MSNLQYTSRDNSREDYTTNYDTTTINNTNSNQYEWLGPGKIQLRTSTPIVKIPVIQKVYNIDKIHEIPDKEQVRLVQPVIYNQNVIHDLPKVEINYTVHKIDIPNLINKEVEQEKLNVHQVVEKYKPVWQICKVPRPIYNQVNDENVIEVPIPHVQYNDQIIERETVVDTIEKYIEKVIYEDVYEEEIEYKYVPVDNIQYKDNHLMKSSNKINDRPIIYPYIFEKSINLEHKVDTTSCKDKIDHERLLSNIKPDQRTPYEFDSVSAEYVKYHKKINQPSN